MIHGKMIFNDHTFECLENWAVKGNLSQKKGAIWLAMSLSSMEETGQIRGDCVAGTNPVYVWHLSQCSCNVLYRCRKPSRRLIKFTVDRALDGSHDWRQLGTSVLSDPNGP